MRKALPWLRGEARPEKDGKVRIEGTKVVLREKLLSDIANDYAWRTDEELAKLDATRPIRMSYDEFFRYSREELFYNSSSSKRLGIDTFDGHHIGNCMYYDIDSRRGEAELGIMIGDRDYWGKGYGADAVEALLRHLFTTTGLDRVYLHTLDWNRRAQQSFGKAGFKQLGVVRRTGMDFIKMEVLRRDWESRQVSNGDRATPDGGLSQDGQGD